MLFEKVQEVIEALPRFAAAAEARKDLILANLAMIGEIPAPTGGEEARVRMIEQRFSEAGLQNVSSDEKQNALGILPGSEGEENLLLVAHVDTVFPETVDHTMGVQSDRVTGPGVADNSLGLAVLASLPDLLEHVGVQLASNLVLMGASRSLGRGNLEGIRFFLSSNSLAYRAAVCVEGVQLGRLSHASVGMLRGEFTCSIPEERGHSPFVERSAILALNDVINHIVRIRLPRRPRSHVFLGQVEGGTSFDQIATQAALRFEIRSESHEVVREVQEEMEEIVGEVASATGAHVALNVFARRRPGGIPFTHPLCAGARRIMRALRIEPRIAPSTAELAAFISRKIPALTIGLTEGEHINEENDTIAIAPMFKGIAQLIGLLAAADGGFCDGP